MNKSKLLVLIIFTILIGCFAVNFGILSKTKYENIIIDIDEWNEIISSRTLTKIDVDNISFNDNLLFKDRQNRYYYSIVDGDNKKYNPTIKYKSKNNFKIAIKEYITDDLVEQNKPLELLFYSNDGYDIIKVYVSTLPLLSIEFDSYTKNIINNDDIFNFRNINNGTLIDKLEKIKDKNYESDNFGDELYDVQNMTIKLYDNRNGVSNRLITSDGFFKYRGATTLSYPKKGYRISLRDGIEKNDISLLGLRSDDDYLLYAAYNDAEKIRNVFASKLWYEGCSNDNSYDASNGMEYKYVELFINGNYEGLYVLGYPIDEKSVELTSGEYMFKKYGWDESELAVLNNSHNMLGYELISDSSDIAFDYLYNYYKKILTVDSSNFKDIYNYMDINNAIDIFLFYNLVQAIDNVNGTALKNTYITIKNDGKVIYTPWDLDITFGNVWTLENNVFTENYSKDSSYNVIFEMNPAYILLKLGDNNIKNLIYQRYMDLRENVWSDSNIMKIIDIYENDIYNSGAYLRDIERWPDGNYFNPSLKLSKFKSYVIERLEEMDKYMEKYN